MTDRILPRYPIYIPSKGRADRCLTARFLARDQVPFYLVVEPQEREEYIEQFGNERVLVLPFRDRGSVIPARNWIKDLATEQGFERHWQFDDNIRQIRRVWHGKRIPCDAAVALASTEDLVDRYENVALAGLNYQMFAIEADLPPFSLNVHVYSCTLVLNSLPNRWRGRYNEDADLCLQVLADGWCTVLVNVFVANKARTMIMKGGNTDELYSGDGRLKMARSLERRWPGVVEVKRRWGRPQHVIKYAWRRFDTPLKLKEGIDLDKIQPNDYGLKLKQKKKIRSKGLRKVYRDYPKEDN